MERKVEIRLKQLVDNKRIFLRDLARLSDIDHSFVINWLIIKQKKSICHMLRG